MQAFTLNLGVIQVDYLAKTKEYFYEAVKKHPTCPSELRHSLLRRHPNVEKYLLLLSREITKAQSLGIKRRGQPYKPKHIKEFVNDMTDMFIRKLTMEADRRIEAEATKRKREAEAQKALDLAATSEGKFQGEYAELAEGVITDDKTSPPQKS